MRQKTTTFVLLTAVLSIVLFVSMAVAKEKKEDAPKQVLVKNVRIFNGVDDKLIKGHVLVENNLIKKIGKDLKAGKDATVIDGGGRTLMPGLIDLHSHLCVQNGLPWGRDNWDQMAMGAMTGDVLKDFLQQGFTTSRDVGCNTLGMAKAVRLGRIDGPRIFSSGGWLSQTGGHADLGRWNDPLHGAENDLGRSGQNHVVDGVAEVIKAARHNFRAGATQIKIMAGGGVSSEFDPIHTTQFSLEEMKAIVSIAEDYGSYVSAHAYHDRSVNRAIDAGIKVIEHAFLISEGTVKRMAKEGIIWSLQAEMSYTAFAKPEEITFFTPEQQDKARAMYAGVKQVSKWMRKHGVKIATGSDMFGDGYVERQADNVITTVTGLGFTNLEALKMTTSNAAEVLNMSGLMSPYREGALGVIQEGAYADIIIVDGDPLTDIKALKRDRVKLVMKDGKIYKNTL
ncbi:MAG: amidohydrolase family protein [Planctomycetes bacterium]|nr:amidohydrolase family protein [Planctomycetota bacterium]